MEYLIASAIGLLTAGGVYLVLRMRSFPVIVGLTMISYACNVFIFASGRIVAGLPPILSKTATGYTDPMPQALVITGIVVAVALSAVGAAMIVRVVEEAATPQSATPAESKSEQ